MNAVFKPVANNGGILQPDQEVAMLEYGQALAPGARYVAAYAASRSPSRGRVVAEPECPTRSPWQRDRDRVLHSTTFRRLTYKTQMFVYHEGDHFRTRLTHSLEVAQIARTIARQLLLDEDLAEVLALAHDLGHPPFGHAGERALDAAVADIGGFDHNVQSFRAVTKLEAKYAHFGGLNLTWETLEGLIKHNGPPAKSGLDRDRRVVRALESFQRVMDLQLDTFASGEAQVAAIADDIAWHTHDIDDGLRAGLITTADLEAVPITRDVLGGVSSLACTDTRREIYEIVRRLITILVADAVDASRERLKKNSPRTPDDIRAAGHVTISFSEEMTIRLAELRRFLFKHLYHHERVLAVMNGAERIVADLVLRYREDQTLLPDRWRAAAEARSEEARLRLISDFVAGMTDRYAIAEHERLFDDTPDLR